MWQISHTCPIFHGFQCAFKYVIDMCRIRMLASVMTMHVTVVQQYYNEAESFLLPSDTVAFVRWQHNT